MVILKTKLKNAIDKRSPGNSYEYNIRNISINGDKRGCSGIIGNPKTGLYVYVTTEKNGCVWLKPYMFRRAKNMNDYQGETNLWEEDFDSLVKNVVLLLETNDYPRGLHW